jgi:hypothetical protein
VYNGDKFSAKDSYEPYTKKYLSCGVLSITVEEVKKISPLLPMEDNTPFDGHCYIDFSRVTSKN